MCVCVCVCVCVHTHIHIYIVKINDRMIFQQFTVFLSYKHTIQETIHHFLTTINKISKLHTNLCKLQTSR